MSLLTVASVASLTDSHTSAAAGSLAALDSPALRIISDQDQADVQQIKYHIANEYSDFKTINEVIAFLDKVKLLVQKHPKNIAFAQGDLKEVLKFLSQETVTKLIRVDTDPFVMPISEDKIPLAQRAIDEDELTRKLFSGPVRSLVEVRRQQLSRGSEDSNHKDGNFFTNFWCKISGGCQNQ